MSRSPLVLVLALALAAGPARADVLSGATGPVQQHEHRATITLRPGHAEWVVRRTLGSEGAATNAALVQIMLPHPESTAASALLGLRLLGAEPVDATLLDAQAARHGYERGGGAATAAALLELAPVADDLFIVSDEARLWVAPLSGSTRQTVEYRLVMQLPYEDGAYRLAIPPAGPELAPAIVAEPEDGTLLVAGRRHPGGAVSYRPRRGVELALVPNEAAGLEGAVAVVPFGDDLFTHVRVAAPSRFSTAPGDSYIALVIDASRSLGEADVRAEVAAARAYLSSFAAAHVEVITFDRAVHARYGTFVGVSEARRDLAQLVLERRNGSEVAQALTAAAERLAEAPATAQRRLVLFTDGLVREGITAAAIDAVVDPTLAVAHVARVRSGEQPWLTADGEHAWHDAVAKTGGVVWDGVASVDAAREEELTTAYRQLARATTLEHVYAESAGWLTASAPSPWRLGEGQGFSQADVLPERLPWVTLHGQLWQREVSTTLAVTPRETEVWTALASRSERALTVDLGVLRQLAHRAGSVTALTSYATAPLQEAPLAVLAQEVEPGPVVGTISGDCGGAGFHRGGRQRWLTDRLLASWLACGGDQHRARITLETTGLEVAAVGSVSSRASDALKQCLTDATWALELDERFDLPERASWEVTVRPVFR